VIILINKKEVDKLSNIWARIIDAPLTVVFELLLMIYSVVFLLPKAIRFFRQKESGDPDIQKRTHPKDQFWDY